jgi:hypothetical protein
MASLGSEKYEMIAEEMRRLWALEDRLLVRLGEVRRRVKEIREVELFNCSDDTMQDLKEELAGLEPELENLERIVNG